MALQKFIHKVSPQLTQNAQFKAYGDIPENQLTAGSTVELYPVLILTLLVLMAWQLKELEVRWT